MSSTLHKLDAVPRPAKSHGGSAARAPTSRKGPHGSSSGGRGATVSRSSNCEQIPNACEWCAEHPFDVCRACARLGRSAARLLDAGGLSAAQVAEMLGLEVARMQRLLEEERALRDLQRYKRDRIPLAPIQALFARRQEEDPSLSKTRGARGDRTNNTPGGRRVGPARAPGKDHRRAGAGGRGARQKKTPGGGPRGKGGAPPPPPPR